ncbi:MAG: DnaJ domain-containing protein [Oscillospiraceae bacterium]|nr:DnaJ domain-containing protein [Oscillospiraceae bacterium]
MVDYYAALGVMPDAGADTIRARYRKLAKECHPDLHPGDKAAETRFKEIGEAWEVLGDPDKRAKYDAGRAPKKAARKPSVPVGEVDFSKVMDQFDSFFGKAVAPTGGKQQKNPLDATDLFEKFMGIKK